MCCCCCCESMSNAMLKGGSAPLVVLSKSGSNINDFGDTNERPKKLVGGSPLDDERSV